MMKSSAATQLAETLAHAITAGEYTVEPRTEGAALLRGRDGDVAYLLYPTGRVSFRDEHGRVCSLGIGKRAMRAFLP